MRFGCRTFFTTRSEANSCTPCWPVRSIILRRNFRPAGGVGLPHLAKTAGPQMVGQPIAGHRLVADFVAVESVRHDERFSNGNPPGGDNSIATGSPAQGWPSLGILRMKARL